MTTATQVLDKARSQLGVTEKPVNRTPYGVWYGMDGQAWCAMFVSWVFNEAGLPIPAKQAKGFAYCPDGVNYFKRIRRWFDTPEVGDVVFYKFDGDGLSDHVGIVETINRDGSIIAIEGNTNAAGSANGDRVMRRTRSRNQIMGFGRPAYDREKGFPVPPMPKTLSVTEYPEENMRVIEFAVPRLDDQGNGWIHFNGNGVPDVPFEKLAGVIGTGSAPSRDKGYWPVPTFGKNNTDGKALVTILGGRPKDSVILYLSVLN